MIASPPCKHILGIAITLLPLMGVVAKAQDQKIKAPVAKPGWYAAIGAGAGWPANPSVTSAERGSLLEGIDYTFTGSTTASLSAGAAVEAGVGYAFGSNVRSELSYVFTSPSLDSSSFQGRLEAAGLTIPFDGRVSGEGSAKTNSIFVSGYYDIPVNSRFSPYVGGGIGWTNVAIPAQILVGTLRAPAGIPFVSRSEGGNASAFGYQAKLGVSYLAASNTDLFLEGTYQGNTAVTIQSLSIGALNQFGVRAGIRYRFGG